MRKSKKNTSPVTAYEGNIEELIIQALLEKGAQDVVSINLKPVRHVLFDYFIICTGTSKPHVETLTDFVIETTKKQAGIRPAFVEGTLNNEWVLLDYFNVIVHVFQPEARQYYSIEKLWNDAEIQHF
ncbi:MAG: ribosome silencing factor [Bacteroidales bacterium]|jgi:ribosome-associated protein|nr:ribosome silencing factor [Bacteroidales bacterium]